VKNFDLLIYAHKGNIQGIEKCIKSGCDINFQDENGNTALMIAIASAEPTKLADFDEPKAALKLIELGANLTIRNHFNHTALMMAAFYRHKRLAEVLVEKGVTGLEGRFARDFASSRGYFVIAKHLNNWYKEQDKVKKLLKDTQAAREKIIEAMGYNKFPIMLPHKTFILSRFEKNISSKNEINTNKKVDFKPYPSTKLR
jgi:ankyrin repeat protein